MVCATLVHMIESWCVHTHVTCEAKAMMSAWRELAGDPSASKEHSWVFLDSLDEISNGICCLVQHGFNVAHLKKDHHFHSE